MRHLHNTASNEKVIDNSISTRVSFEFQNFWKSTFEGFNKVQIVVVLVYLATMLIVFSSLLYYIISTGRHI